MGTGCWLLVEDPVFKRGYSMLVEDPDFRENIVDNGPVKILFLKKWNFMRYLLTSVLSQLFIQTRERQGG